MAKIVDNRTKLQKLTDVIIGTGTGAATRQNSFNNVATYNINPSSEVLYRFDNKEARDQKLLQLKQQKLLSYQWKKINYDSTMNSLAGAATQVKVMYRDADLMDQCPEISAALDIYAEEATTTKKGKILNIYSKSERIKAILEDLFINRLDLNVTLPAIVRSACKYGNDFWYLNIDDQNGILGWRPLDVHQMLRIESGLESVYGGPAPSANLYNLKPDEVKFVWEGHNETQPFMNWQIAHFRLIKNTIYLPYGCAITNGARRYWRLWSMMEDALFLYRLERSVERRIFKVNVGAIDEADVPAYIQEFANNIKRAPIIDPQTGQIDLRRNFLDVSQDFVIPVRPGQEGVSSIDTLNAAQLDHGMEDIEYMQNKILSVLKVPKTFLNFQEAQGKGQNLALMDIRFSRTINWIQQTILMELTKVAIIHLYLLGFEDDLTNFSLTMNNPSNQIEMMELDNMTKRMNLAAMALADQGNGIPLMSWHDVQKEILGKTDAEISDMLNEIRLESAIATELQLTSQIIKKTGLFDKADRLYGEPGAKYDFRALEGGEMGGPGGGGLGGGGSTMPMDSGFGDEIGDIGGADMSADMGGEEGSTDLGGDLGGNEGGEQGSLMEVRKKDKRKPLFEDIFDRYNKEVLTEKEVHVERPKIINKGLMINEELMAKLEALEKIHKDNTEKEE